MMASAVEEPNDDLHGINGVFQIAESSPLSAVPSELDLEPVPDVEAPLLPPPEDVTPQTAHPAKETIERVSTRQRKVPSRYESDPEPKDPSSSEATPAKRKLQPLRGNFSADFLLSSPKSKLTTINLTQLLYDERAWTELSREQQLHLISMLPDPPSVDDTDPSKPLPNVLAQYLKNNSSFQADVRLFQEDLKEGRYNPVWIRDAQAASEKRAKGNFDDWKEKNREAFWGQKQKFSWGSLAGDTSMHTLQDLVRGGVFQVGDVFALRRAKGMGKEQIVAEKEAKIIAINEDDNTLSFSFPPGQHKFSAPANCENIVVEEINGPRPLSDAILVEDGRIQGQRGANAWMEFRCIRKNQDMGTLWDMRELYHKRNFT